MSKTIAVFSCFNLWGSWAQASIIVLGIITIMVVFYFRKTLVSVAAAVALLAGAIGIAYTQTSGSNLVIDTLIMSFVAVSVAAAVSLLASAVLCDKRPDLFDSSYCSIDFYEVDEKGNWTHCTLNIYNCETLLTLVEDETPFIEIDINSSGKRIYPIRIYVPENVFFVFG